MWEGSYKISTHKNSKYKMNGQDSISEQEKHLACIESRLKNYNTDERWIKLVYTIFSKIN